LNGLSVEAEEEGYQEAQRALYEYMKGVDQNRRLKVSAPYAETTRGQIIALVDATAHYVGTMVEKRAGTYVVVHEFITQHDDEMVTVRVIPDHIAAIEYIDKK